jgi:hypothetical protein
MLNSNAVAKPKLKALSNGEIGFCVSSILCVENEGLMQVQFR